MRNGRVSRRSPELVKVNPITGNALEEPGVSYDGEPAGSYRQANPGWSGAERAITVPALRGEWVGFALVCQNLKDGGEWSVTPHALSNGAGGEIPASAIRLSRLWYQKVGGGPRDWYGDPLLPLLPGERFRIPDARNGIPGQTTQTIHAELLVPPQAAPGSYAGTIDLADGASAPLSLRLTLVVAGATMPQRTAFQFSMNAYSSPGEYFGPGGSDAFLAGERAFYVMAHEHRTTLAVLGYGHSAHFQDGIAWPLTGSGSAMAVKDWSAWDRRFGPLFDGSAFAGGPRAGVALDHFYLPFMESWPTPMAVGYGWNALTWEEHWQGAGPVAEGFNPLYRQQWIAVMRDFEQHVMAKGWQTAFQVYLNDKYFYKQYDPKRKRDGDGTSFWLLDEPQHIDDFSALAYFGTLIRAAQQGDRSRVLFRADISRPQWGRDLLDRLLDLNVSGGFATFRPWLEDWRERDGQRVWTYGGAPPSTSSAYVIERQALDLYARGVDGFVPWLTLGDERSWTEFADTCVFYDGKPMGIMGPCASLRLKAYRRGEQDVEYVQLLAGMLGLLAHDPARRQVAGPARGRARRHHAARHPRCPGRGDRILQGPGARGFRRPAPGDRGAAEMSLRRTALLLLCLLGCGLPAVRLAGAEPAVIGPADVAARAREVGEQLGAGFTVLSEGPFVVAGDEPAATVRDHAREIVRWTCTMLRKDFFSADPDAVYSIYLFKDKESYEANAACACSAPSPSPPTATARPSTMPW